MRIDVVEGNDCSPPFTVGFDVCYDHFRTIIDGCNTGGENGKKLEAVFCFSCLLIMSMYRQAGR